MPRPDVAEATPVAADPQRRSRRSGFWATVDVPGARPGTARLELLAELADGTMARTDLATLDVVAATPAPPTTARSEDPAVPLLAVCMATHEPDERLFAAQVASLRAQEDRGWVCLISDDASSPEALARVRAELGDDPRFALSPAPGRLGFYRNFERVLGLAPATAQLVALCDQDDVWHPGKLGALRAALGAAPDAVLAYCDQRLVDEDGRLLRPTLWEGRRENHDDVTSALVAGGITGAACALRRDLLDVVLPFPHTPGLAFHDHWIGLAAMAAGDVAYIDRPLYDYVQHGGAVFGEVTSGVAAAARARWRPTRASLTPWRAVLEGWRAAYFHGYVPREVLARTALARCAAPLARRPARRRALHRYVAAERSLVALIALAARALRPLTGRDETLGSEAALARGVAWRRLADVLRRVRTPGGRELGDARVPPPHAFEQRRLRRWRARMGTLSP